MAFYQQLYAHLGYLTIPLIVCSLITLGLLLEKLVSLAVQTWTKTKICSDAPVYSDKQQPALVVRGLNLLCAHRNEPKALREEIAVVWLNSQRNKLASGIQVLQVMALLTPLLGLLGTVLGLIKVFEKLAGHNGPIEPSLLADGLGMAMHTTAMGLIIALPALAGAHGFQIWIDKIIYRTEHDMNTMNLLFDGVAMEKRDD
jgi:biopolymer transport protein ExbB